MKNLKLFLQPKLGKNISQLFIKEEMKSERYANNARYIFTLLYVLLGFGVRDEIPPHSFHFIILASFINLVFTTAIHFYIKRGRHYWWVKYASVCFDILLLSAFLYSIGTYRTFKTEAFLAYYLWISLATIRFSPLLTLLAGTLSIVLYSILSLLAIYSGTVELGSITDEFTSPQVSISNIVIRLAFLTIFTGVAVYISRIYYIIATKAIREGLLVKKTTQLGKTLDRLRATQKELASKNRELAQLSEIDTLTQLYNRRKIDQIMEDTLNAAQADNQGMAIIILDIDRFKSINDTFGHQMGDEVIVKVTKQLTDNIRENDSIGRWGGEEFLIICPDTDREAVETLSERLRMCIASHDFNINMQVTCSFGITLLNDNDTVTTLLKRADDGLFHSKESGRNCITRC